MCPPVIGPWKWPTNGLFLGNRSPPSPPCKLTPIPPLKSSLRNGAGKLNCKTEAVVLSSPAWIDILEPVSTIHPETSTRPSISPKISSRKITFTAICDQIKIEIYNNTQKPWEWIRCISRRYRVPCNTIPDNCHRHHAIQFKVLKKLGFPWNTISNWLSI